MPCIDNYPVTQWHVNNRDMIVHEDFKISFVFEGFMYILVIKKGFVFDGASIPDGLWSVVGSPFIGEYRIPALVHDALYTCADRSAFTQELADDIFKFLMQQFDENSILSEVIYQSVDKFGDRHWDKGTNNLKPEYLEVETYHVNC